MLIVNADDWGLEPIRDQAIVECFRRGWITNTTAVMNRPGLETATQLAHEEKFADRVGLHINLVYDRPLTDGIRRDPLFCDKEGMFNAAFHKMTKTRLWLPDSSKRVVAEEVRAQVAVYKAHGYTMMHADSHQHTHNDWSIMPVVVAALKENGFRSLRIARNMGAGLRLGKKIYKGLYNFYLRHQGLAYSDYFGSIADFLSCREDLPKEATVELMCHPMLTVGKEDRVDGTLTDFYRPFDEQVMNEIARLAR